MPERSSLAANLNAAVRSLARAARICSMAGRPLAVQRMQFAACAEDRIAKGEAGRY